MRFLLDPRFEQELQARPDHPQDCYVRPGEYLHHLYFQGVKYVVAPAMLRCLQQAQSRNDTEALEHLELHRRQYEQLVEQARAAGWLEKAVMLGDPPPGNAANETPAAPKDHPPPVPHTLEETGLNRTVAVELVLRTVYNLGRPTGQEIARLLCLNYKVIEPLLQEMRKGELLEVVGQRGLGDANYEYVLKQPRGRDAAQDALEKTAYMGPAPVPFQTYLNMVKAQSVKQLNVTRRTVGAAFEDLVVASDVLNQVGPAVNSGASIFLFGYPGNGKTSIAERIARLMGDAIYIPQAIEADGQIIKIFDEGVHHAIPAAQGDAPYDARWVKVRRPVIIVGGELVMPMLELSYDKAGKFYEAPLQMKANGGIFMIDDFGRQQMRALDLLNRWIVPLEKRFDYLTTHTGRKLEIPFELLLIFSTNLDPAQLADDAFFRRIKFKIEITDPDQKHWESVWRLVCKGKGVEYDQAGIDYMIRRWYEPFDRPLRMCQPRDILVQMENIARYNMERLSFSPDLIDAACASYFVNLQDAKDFGAAAQL